MNNVKCNNCGSESYVLLTRTKSVGTSGKKSLDIVICKICGLCFLNPQPTRDMYAAYYKTYGRKNRGKEALVVEKHDQRKYVNLLERYLNKSSKILDVGCGKGIFLSFLKEKGFNNLSGIELSEDEIQFAKKEFGLNIEYAAIENYSKKDFDLVTLIATVEHCTDPRESLTIVRSTLKNGGMLFISTPNVKKMILRKGVSNYFKFVHTFYFSMTTLKSIVQQVGFEVVEESITEPEKNRGFLYPRHYKDSDLLLLARKVDRKISPLKDDYRNIMTILRETKKRDFLSSVIFRLDQIWGLGFLFRIMRKMV